MGAQAAKNTTLTPISSRLVRRRLACFRRNVWVLVAASGSRGTAVAILAGRGGDIPVFGRISPLELETMVHEVFTEKATTRAAFNQENNL